METIAQTTIDLADPRLDSDGPPAFTCGECQITHLAADMFAFAASRLRARCAELEARLRTTLDYVEELEGLAHSLERQIAARETPVFADEAPTDVDAFGLIDPPIVAEVVADPFRRAVAGASSDGGCGCFDMCGERCGERCRDGSGRVCDLARHHAGACASIGTDGRPQLVWGQWRV